MKKPIQIAIEDSKKNIINFINNECNRNNIDYYFLSIILKEIYEETLTLKDKELEEMRQELSRGVDNNGKD